MIDMETTTWFFIGMIELLLFGLMTYLETKNPW